MSTAWSFNKDKNDNNFAQRTSWNHLLVKQRKLIIRAREPENVDLTSVNGIEKVRENKRKNKLSRLGGCFYDLCHNSYE